MSGIDVLMSGIDVLMSGIDVLMSCIDVLMSGIDVWMSGIDRCVVKFYLFYFILLCMCSKSGLSRQNSRNLVT